jgi:hypothetical protein
MSWHRTLSEVLNEMSSTQLVRGVCHIHTAFRYAILFGAHLEPEAGLAS